MLCEEARLFLLECGRHTRLGLECLEWLTIGCWPRELVPSDLSSSSFVGVQAPNLHLVPKDYFYLPHFSPPPIDTHSLVPSFPPEALSPQESLKTWSFQVFLTLAFTLDIKTPQLCSWNYSSRNQSVSFVSCFLLSNKILVAIFLTLCLEFPNYFLSSLYVKTGKEIWL